VIAPDEDTINDLNLLYDSAGAGMQVDPPLHDNEDDEDGATLTLRLGCELAELLVERCALMTAEQRGRALEILESRPQLAKHKMGRFDLAFPFHAIVADPGVPLEMIQKVYAMNPRAIKDVSETLPLHEACCNGAAHDVIQFLLNEYPEAAAIKTNTRDGGLLPIHEAVRRINTSLETLQALIDAFPDCMSVKDDGNGYTVCDHAFNDSCNPAMLNFILEKQHKMPKMLKVNTKKHVITDIFRANQPTSVLQNCLKIALPFFEHVQVGGLFKHEEYGDRYMTLLQELCNHYPLRLDILHLHGEAAFLDEHNVFGAIQNILNSNLCLEELVLGLDFDKGTRGPYDLGEDAYALCNDLFESCVRSLHRLTLKGFSFLDDGETLGNLLRPTEEYAAIIPGNKLKDLTLELVRMDRAGALEPEPSNWKMQGAWRQCRLEKLSFVNCHMTEETLLSLLEELAHMPLLRDLELIFKSHVPLGFTVSAEHNDPETIYAVGEAEWNYWASEWNEDENPVFDDIESLNITEPILQILRQGRLVALAVKGPIVDIETFCAALSSSSPSAATTTTSGSVLISPIQKYHVPSSLNSESKLAILADFTRRYGTPTNILLPDEMPIETGWNAFGRALLAEGCTKANIGTLLDILESMEGHPDSNSDSAPMVSDNVTGMYNLLRMAPSVWCRF